MPNQEAIAVIGAGRLDAAILGFERSLNDWRDGWGEHEQLRSQRQREHLDTKGSGMWPPLADSTLRRKLRDPRASFLEILQLTGGLYRSHTAPGAPHNVSDKRPLSFDFGSTDPLGVIHHEGRGRVPKRTVLYVSDSEMSAHEEMLVDKGAAKARGQGIEVVE